SSVKGKRMSGLMGNGTVPSLPPPQPKSPPELYGRRRELAKVQILEREIGFLEEELKSIEGLQLASRSCKEYVIYPSHHEHIIRVVDFVTANVDPLMPSRSQIAIANAIRAVLVAIHVASADCPNAAVFSHAVIVNAVTYSNAAAARDQSVRLVRLALARAVNAVLNIYVLVVTKAAAATLATFVTNL
ncbi:succinyl-diaminopimelate desuccinylase, partial [Striga asiatica]